MSKEMDQMIESFYGQKKKDIISVIREEIDRFYEAKENKKLPTNTGVLFEMAIVYMATGRDIVASQKNGSLISEFIDTPWGKGTLRSYAKEAVARMKDQGVRLNTVMHSSEPGAKEVTAQAGDPKTDIVAGNKDANGLYKYRISVKLPGAIQIASGEMVSTIPAFKAAAGSNDKFSKAVKDIQKDWKQLPRIMISDDNFKKAFVRHLTPFLDNKKNLIKPIRDMIGVSEPEKTPDIPFAISQLEDEGVDPGQISRAIRDTWDSEFKKLGGSGIMLYGEFSDKILSIGEKIEDLFKDESFKELYLREALTGNNQFRNNMNNAANWLLSPDYFLDLYNDDTVKAIMKNFSVKSGDLRSKSRESLSYLVYRAGHPGKIELEESEVNSMIDPLEKLEDIFDDDGFYEFLHNMLDG